MLAMLAGLAFLLAVGWLPCFLLLACLLHCWLHLLVEISTVHGNFVCIRILIGARPC